jgi:hypothetical protein
MWVKYLRHGEPVEQRASDTASAMEHRPEDEGSRDREGDEVKYLRPVEAEHRLEAEGNWEPRGRRGGCG